MRVTAIVKKVLKELFRDKRTLAMIFLAPILVLWLMNVMFASNSSTNAKLAVVDVPHQVNKNLDKVDHVSIKKYTDRTQARKKLKQNKIDGVIYYHHNKYYVDYANTDSSKTALTKQALKAAITGQSITKMKSALTQSQKKLVKLSKQLAVVAQKNGMQVPTKPSAQKEPKQKKAKKAKIINKYYYGNSDTGFFNKIEPILVAFFIFLFVFLISGMALLKERTTGTLDRLLATPVKRSEIIYGYMISYGIVAVIQSIIIIGVTIWLLNIEVAGNVLWVILISILVAMVALAFGFLLSTIAESEFQMMQFIPLVVVPQIFFSGIIPLDSMANWVSYLGKILPLTYAGDALNQVILYGRGFESFAGDMLALLIFIVVLVALNIVGLKRYRKV
ncbi:ABC transporter permease [Lactobacillus juensis]|uniref:ABC transporter permease n=1 Tax=Lactobacillus juensis TaxID=3082862 RepID=UPI0030C6C139